ncbi:MAG: Ycf66 family protein [Microcoleaceae cyanobacterium]
MLTYILAIAVAISSLGLYMAAFFFPEIHRKNDFVWSGVGLFYALILWVCAGRITGAVLLGQTASVALLGWLGWQTVTLRRRITPELLKTPIPESIKQRTNQVLPSPGATVPATVSQPVALEKSPQPETLESVEPTILQTTPINTVEPVTPIQNTPLENAPPTVLQEATEAAEELIEEATEKAKDAAEAVEEWVDTATDKAEDIAKDVAEVAEEWVETAANKAEDAADVAADKIKETVAEVKEEAKILSNARPTAKTKSKRQNPLAQILGVVTGIFKRKQKPPTASIKTAVTKPKTPAVTPTPTPEPANLEVVEQTTTEVETVETIEPANLEVAEQTTTEVETVDKTESEPANKSPFEELTSTPSESEVIQTEAELIAVADELDQNDNPVVQTNSPIKLNIENIEEIDLTIETVEVVEEPVTEPESTIETAEIVEKPETEDSIEVGKTDNTVSEAEPDEETQDSPTPPSLKRPNSPNKENQ